MDYSLVPLMVQQNYLSARIAGASTPQQQRIQISKAADAFLDGDAVGDGQNQMGRTRWAEP